MKLNECVAWRKIGFPIRKCGIGISVPFVFVSQLLDFIIIILLFGGGWVASSEAYRAIPGAVLRSDLWWCSGRPYAVPGWNWGQLHTRRAPYPLYCLSDRNLIIFILQKFHGSWWTESCWYASLKRSVASFFGGDECALLQIISLWPTLVYYL